MTGLTLGIAGFSMLWIPYVSIVGGLLLLIGVIFLVLGRHAFGEPHRRSVVRGGVLLVIAILGVVVVAIEFAASLVSAASMPGATVAQIGAQLKGDVVFLVVSDAVVGALLLLSAVLLVYQLADPSTRTLLWAALVIGIGVSVSVAAVLLPQVTNAIAQATSSATVNLGPIDSLQTESTLLGLANVIPDLLFAWAYYRVWRRTSPGSRDPRPYSRTSA